MRVLDARARILARQPESPDRDGSQELLIASVGDARLAWDIHRVREVLPPGPLARLPGEGHLLVGVRNVGGELVAVADIASLLGLSHNVGPAGRWVVVIEENSGPLGVHVDRANELVTIPLDSLRSAPTSGKAPVTGVISHLTPDGALVIDVDALLTQPVLSVRPARDETTQEEATWPNDA